MVKSIKIILSDCSKICVSPGGAMLKLDPWLQCLIWNLLCRSHPFFKALICWLFITFFQWFNKNRNHLPFEIAPHADTTLHYNGNSEPYQVASQTYIPEVRGDSEMEVELRRRARSWGREHLFSWEERRPPPSGTSHFSLWWRHCANWRFHLFTCNKPGNWVSKQLFS